MRTIFNSVNMPGWGDPETWGNTSEHPNSPDYDDTFAQAVEKEKDDLLDGNYSPSLFENVCEALDNAEPSDSDVTALQAALNEKDYEQIGILIGNISDRYWKPRADHKAIQNIRIACQKARDDDQRALEDW